MDWQRLRIVSVVRINNQRHDSDDDVVDVVVEWCGDDAYDDDVDI